jgi:hypothetical protein
VWPLGAVLFAADDAQPMTQCHIHTPLPSLATEDIPSDSSSFHTVYLSRQV